MTPLFTPLIIIQYTSCNEPQNLNPARSIILLRGSIKVQLSHPYTSLRTAILLLTFTSSSFYCSFSMCLRELPVCIQNFMAFHTPCTSF